MSKILLVEDKESLRTMIQRTLEAEGYEVDIARDGAEGYEKVRRHRYLMMLTDFKLPARDGIELLRLALEVDSQLPVVVMTAYGTIDDAVRAMKLGAYDFLPKPFENHHLVHLVSRAIERRELLFQNLVLREEFKSRLGFPTIVGENSTLRDVSQAIRRAGPTDVSILLTGESGTGKELFARAIHSLSPRVDRPFIAINCAAIPETLLENELFGHERGAYTGAGDRKMGKFEMAHRGTILLDEIGELSPSVQSKILRVLQEKSFERVGGTATIEVDVRIIAATNRDLQRAVAERQFRQDLFYRLNVFPIEIPPLRARRDDIALLADHFVGVYAREMNKGAIALSPAALQVMQGYHWPGNVRELQNCMERAVILCDGAQVLPHHLNLPGDGRGQIERELRNVVSLEGTLAQVVERATQLVEKVKIEQALRETGGNRGRAAEMLGVSPKTLSTKIRDLEIGETP